MRDPFDAKDVAEIALREVRERGGKVKIVKHRFLGEQVVVSLDNWDTRLTLQQAWEACVSASAVRALRIEEKMAEYDKEKSK